MTLITRMFVTDAVSMRDPARERERQRLTDRIANLKVQSYADPGCADTKQALEQAQDELRMFDRGSFDGGGDA